MRCKQQENAHNAQTCRQHGKYKDFYACYTPFRSERVKSLLPRGSKSAADVKYSKHPSDIQLSRGLEVHARSTIALGRASTSLRLLYRFLLERLDISARSRNSWRHVSCGTSTSSRNSWRKIPGVSCSRAIFQIVAAHGVPISARQRLMLAMDLRERHACTSKLAAHHVLVLKQVWLFLKQPSEKSRRCHGDETATIYLSHTSLRHTAWYVAKRSVRKKKKSI